MMSIFLHLFAAACDPNAICLSPLPHASATNGKFITALSVVFAIAGGLAVLMITISGIRYAISAGDPQGISQAKKGIVYALIGLTICILAEAIVNFALSGL